MEELKKRRCSLKTLWIKKKKSQDFRWGERRVVVSQKYLGYVLEEKKWSPTNLRSVMWVLGQMNSVSAWRIVSGRKSLEATEKHFLTAY